MKRLDQATWHSRLFIATSVWASFLAGLWELPCMQLSAALAEQADSTTANMPAGSGVSPRGKRNIRDLQMSGWRKVCFEVSPAEKVCRTTNSGLMETGQQMVRFDLIETGAAEGRIQMLLPHGMYLRADVALRVDQGEPLRIPFDWCFANACVAAGPASPRFISELRSGRILTVEMVDSSLLTISAALSLDPFKVVNDGPPVHLFDDSLSPKN
ncbi:invasion associated locus B family protein [Bradyrhizobium sp. MOS002]|uniref:invasion associated locus B family protein n=1 Tax=Bradyrhizobium sp. MOS002 TaxID=2133947 RepID=UPI000D13D165|nr:invasion associated locus B family protein [Bradyrhizobium sp. MOS002]PSO31323.1 invasion-associated locus B family protein [Bradyrhizobium sp. MOS002]